MTREEAKGMLPIMQAYADDGKREVINEELEEKAKEQPCVTIENFIAHIKR